MFRFILILFIGLNFVGCQHLNLSSLSEISSKPKVGVIVGAGGVRSLSALGILKELQNHQIQVDTLIGIGWGAWVAALYAQNQSVDEVRWSFHKLSQRGFFESSFLRRQTRALSIHKLKDEIDENFKSFPSKSESSSKNLRVSQSQISFFCPTLTKNGQRVWRGPEFLANCLALPPFFRSEGEMGSLFSIQEAISFLKKKGINVIIWVDSLESEGFSLKNFPEESRWMWQEARLQFLNLEVPKGVYRLSPRLEGYSLLDFSKVNLVYEESLKQAPSLLKILQKEFPYRNF